MLYNWFFFLRVCQEKQIRNIIFMIAAMLVN